VFLYIEYFSDVSGMSNCRPDNGDEDGDYTGYLLGQKEGNKIEIIFGLAQASECSFKARNVR